MKKKLLIAGGGYADIPLIKAAQNLGYHTITSGNNPNDHGHRIADETHLEDFSSPERMLVLAQKLRIDAICSCCNDFSAISSAYVAEKMGLPGHDRYETSLLIHHKDSYRNFARQHNINSPDAVSFTSQSMAIEAADTFNLPAIIKPVDLTGGKGISVAHSKSELIGSIEKAFSMSRAKRIVIENYISGSRHGFSALIKNKKIIFHFEDNEYFYWNPYLVGAASTPTTVSKHAIDKLIKDCELIAEKLSLVDGIFHVQFILSEDEPTIIEICRRPPGDLYINLVSLACRIDYPRQIVRSMTGLGIDEIEPCPSMESIVRHCIMPPKNGTIRSICFASDIQPLIVDQYMWWAPGDKVDNFLTHKLGIVFIKFPSPERMHESMTKINKLIHVEIE